jgi:hypothetical protein
MAKKYPFTKANVQETQEAVYKYIVEYISANAYSPSIRDICVGVGLKSTSTVHNHLRRLSEEGLIQFHEGKRRTIRVPALDAVDSQEIPLVGTVTAGKPVLATENIECLLDAYIIDEKYERVFDILEVAEKRSVDSEFIRETRNRLAYLTKLTYDTYEDVGVFSKNRCPVMNDKGLWGYLSHTGRKLSRFEYSAAGPFTSSGFAPVVSKEGEAFFIDKDNDQVTEIDERFARLGPIVSDVFPAEAKDGKYYLVNRNNEILSEPYDFVSSVNSGVAIAKSGTQWVRIDTSGVPISGQAYSDVVLDDRGFFNRNERYFAKEGDLFALYDIEGNIVGGERFEDARLFTDKGFAAVKKDGQWGFVNVEGDLVIEPAYDDARSFSNDVAAVKIEDKWGFIDPEGKLVIEATFDEVKDFSGKGTCFVKIETKWRLLSLYRLNR